MTQCSTDGHRTQKRCKLEVLLGCKGVDCLRFPRKRIPIFAWRAIKA